MTTSRVMTLATLSGALLLFGMEPMVGRMLVPYYGSAVSTWLTALMFFQVVLFGGYLYAHLVAPRIGRWHLGLLLLPLIRLPIGVVGEVSPEAPMAQIVLTLTLSIGIPFFVLSTTAVVMQMWWSRSTVGAEREPYPLYAASNAGSLIALLGYPFFVEPLLGLWAQSLVWSLGYLVYAGLVCWAFFVGDPDFSPVPVAESDESPPTGMELALWALLAALPSGFLLAVTSVIASEVGSFPMIWVLPLAIYLGTFVLLFRDHPIGLGLRRFWPEVAALGALGFALSGGSSVLHLCFQLLVYFLFCQVLHGELYARRPSARWLTRYYLAMSFGGGVGGVVVNMLPPVIFDGYFEYPLLIALFFVLFVVLGFRQLKADFAQASLPVAAGRLLVIQGALALVAFGQFLVYGNPAVDVQRNFYGIFRVVDDDGVRSLVHGSTSHGSQNLDPAKRSEALSYFREGGCLNDTYAVVKRPRRMGVLGLGAGVVGVFGGEGDVLDFYEIDPGNEALARRWFSFLDDTPAKVTVYVGDGRLKLVSEGKDPYDLVHLDAFSGDGIPTHLMTVEAVRSYLTMLEEDGLILFHLSNRYYDLRPIVKAITSEVGLEVVFSPPGSTAICMVAARTGSSLEALRGRGWVDAPPGLPIATPWTDDYINVLWPLYWGRGESYAAQRRNQDK